MEITIVVSSLSFVYFVFVYEAHKFINNRMECLQTQLKKDNILALKWNILSFDNWTIEKCFPWIAWFFSPQFLPSNYYLNVFLLLCNETLLLLLLKNHILLVGFQIASCPLWACGIHFLARVKADLLFSPHMSSREPCVCVRDGRAESVEKHAFAGLQTHQTDYDTQEEALIFSLIPLS